MTYSFEIGPEVLISSLDEDGRALVADVADGLTGEVESICDAINARVRAEVPALSGVQKPLLDAMDRSTTSNIEVLRRMLAEWTIPRDATAPPEAVSWAVELARHSVPVETLLQIYRIGHAGFWHIWSRSLAERVSDTRELGAVSAATSAFLFAYIESVTAELVSAHESERWHVLHRDQALLLSEVSRVLSGDRVAVPDSSRRLRYRLGSRHQGFILWLPGEQEEWTGGTGAEDAAAGIALRHAATVVTSGARGSLVVPGGPERDMLFGWVELGPGEDGKTGAGSAAGIDRIDPATLGGVHAAIGDPGSGVEGFRRTHRQAGSARRLAMLSTVVTEGAVRQGRQERQGRVIRFRDTAVETLLTADGVAARDFMEQVLGGVLRATDADVLLETVAVYQQEGLSLRRAAERLSVHPNTVSYRVSKVTGVTGDRDAGSLRLRAAVALAVRFR